MLTSSVRIGLVLSLLVALACGDDGGSPDAAGPCAVDLDCADGIFCNGAERCAEGDPSADMRGCVPGEEPCSTGQVCAEEASVCATDCSLAEDLDGDGVAALICGGDDCDDADPSRYPGNPEICDTGGVDEDCDSETLGGTDADEDGYVSAECCNGERCGLDCDDSRADVNPESTEACNGRDDDCDGDVDEEVLVTFYLDGDDDGFGVETDTTEACEVPAGYAYRAGDCDDAVSTIHPGAPEICDTEEVDEDCSGVGNDLVGGCTCTVPSEQRCTLPGACGGSLQSCVEGAWSRCGVQPADEEVCGDEIDGDCDGAIDEGCECTGPNRPCGSSEGACSRGIQDCRADGSWGECRDTVGPTAETCNDSDDDCDGAVDEGARTACWSDEDRDGFAATDALVEWVCDPGDCGPNTTLVDPATSADCDGGDDRAYPGQTAFFTTPRSTVGGYDFDCSGSIQRGTGPTGFPGNGSCPVVAPCDVAPFTRGAPPCGGYPTVYVCAPTGDSSMSCAREVSCVGLACSGTSGPPQSCR